MCSTRLGVGLCGWGCPLHLDCGGRPLPPGPPPPIIIKWSPPSPPHPKGRVPLPKGGCDLGSMRM